ncbi:MAG: thiamine phosphate synthase [Prevotella bivia]|uniref:Thiamine-phosphate synthase n=1 Tax=Prevotella bivia TaxID=28125 RepID=A0A137T057_9BACT|nr:thiamine phosphate synthase [Prevotella bivia]KXO18108.1 putative thiamine-phosphate diphosphorylase [Prevotella bivia]KXU60185.1 putative thiamine-phosphate diphosphorylase [Prevotella bivia]MBS6328561.1 thiamine phosphate synthase [Prevotella bivia]MDU5343850.1 thiamine phosphate synthase [Prevotella bivia]MDU6554196.1 thiamine phosphate synthase [Prevotella bivia]
MTSIQYITHENQRLSYLDGAILALMGGCKWVQLRMKEASDEEFLVVGSQLRELCKIYSATFILDDRVHLVKPLGADGVHLGKNDMPIDEARRCLQSDKVIIGGTANTFDDIKRLHQQGANYIGCGPFRYTETKKKLAPILGFQGYKSLVEKMKSEGITLPIFAIGGILYDDVKALLSIGIDGIAISGGVLNADNPIEKMKLLMKLT